MEQPSSRPSAIRAIVTGHTRGLGAALAAQLLARGVDVLGVSRSRPADPGTRHAARMTSVELDLADGARMQSWLATDALRRFSDDAQCVLLFNNAGIVEPIGPPGMQDIAAIASAVAVNVAAPLMLTSALVEATPDVADLRVVHVSSGAARNAYAGWSIYCATKAALDHHARAVALDANRSLRICSVAPGVVDTDMQATIRASTIERFPSRERFEQLKTTGALSSAESAAKRLVDYALSEGFGASPTADVRDLPDD